jgi:single-strand DNA-binding protein
MAGYNHLTIVGNVGKDPTMKFTQAGVPVCDFTIAINEKYGDKETVTWVRVTCWRQLAEIAAKYVRKGGQVMVAGRVSVSAYTDKAGQPAAALELSADKLVLLGSRADAGPNETPDDAGQIPF